MFLNSNNLCTFEGRMVKDPEISYISIKNGAEQMAKVRFTLAVDRNMTQQQKEAAKAAGQPTADFIPFEMIGARAEFVSKYFPKGKPAKVVAGYKSFSYQKDGQTVYAHVFDVVDITFTLSDYSEQNGQGVQSGAASRPAPANNDQFNDGFSNAISDEDMPF